jgi:hypothetical protein
MTPIFGPPGVAGSSPPTITVLVLVWLPALGLADSVATPDAAAAAVVADAETAGEAATEAAGAAGDADAAAEVAAADGEDVAAAEAAGATGDDVAAVEGSADDAALGEAAAELELEGDAR